jgi:predicted DNA-binding protein
MVKWKTFSFRLTIEDRKAIDELAYRLRRTRADTLRMLIKAGLATLEKEQTNREGEQNEHSHK